jgi:LmbE family N-acetylglucosaminyl deacetylase
MKRLLSCGLMMLAACLHAPASDEPDDTPLSKIESALFKDGARTLQIVAHEDDDLGLMLPTLQYTIASGATVETVFLTAGDAGFGNGYPTDSQAPSCQSYWQGREEGIKQSYAKMAGLATSAPWTTTMRTFNGRLVRQLQLNGKPVFLLFMGLPNPPLEATASLLNLWQGVATSLQTVRDSRLTPRQTYSREDLIVTLTQIIADFAPQHINTLDSTRIYQEALPYEHPDHVASALFALAAKQRWATTHTTRMYRAYNIMFEAENLSSADEASKTAIWNTYWPNDKKICTTGQADVCAGNPTNIQTCDDSAIVYDFQQSRLYTIGTVQGVAGLIRGPASGSSRLCLKASALSAGSAVLLATCDPASPQQQWQLRKDDTLRASATLCATSTFSPGARNTALTLQTCGTNLASQKFALDTAGKLRGPDATCVEASGTALTTRECSNASGQLSWALQVSTPVYTATSSGVSDTDVPDNRAYYDSLALADIDGGGRADLCVRRSGGIYCALAGAGTSPTFGSSTLRIAQFRDNDSWGGASYGSTVQLADINGDGKADVCGRGIDGVYCATWNSATLQFTGYAKRSSGWDFSDLVGHNLDSSIYGSLRVVDVTGDGKADVCSRNSAGIECAVNTGAGNFAGVTQWTSSEFSDALGWRNDEGGATLRYADLDGDGRVDVCGRGALGMICALNDGSQHFVHPHLWSAGDDFSNGAGWNLQKSYYGSIRLVDLNADGKADVCGRGFDGVVCGLSLGTAFASERPVVAQLPFDDGSGWAPDRYGSTLRFGDLNADGRPDLCVRGPLPGGGGVGVRCASGYGVAP